MPPSAYQNVTMLPPSAVTDKDAAYRESMAAELERMTRLVLEAAELALPALAVPQELNIGAFNAPL